jgi:hypothetical protein
MTRHVDTYWCVIGAMPLTYPWWVLKADSAPQDDPWGENPRKWVNWRVSVQLDRDYAEGVPRKFWGVHMINHEKIMHTLKLIVDNADQYRSEIVDNAELLLIGDSESIDSVDFDSDTADVVLQVALFGEIIFG